MIYDRVHQILMEHPVPCNPIDSKDQGGEACEHGRLPRQHRGSVTQRTGGKGAETLRMKAKAGCSWMRSDAWECCWTFRSNNTYIIMNHNLIWSQCKKYVPNY